MWVPDLPSTLREMLCRSLRHSSTTTVEASVSSSVSTLTLYWRTKLRAKSTISPNTGLQGNRFTVNRGGEDSSHCPLLSLSCVDIIWEVYWQGQAWCAVVHGVTKSWIGLSWWTTNGQCQYYLFSLWNLHSYIRNFFSWPQGFGSCEIYIEYHTND